MAAMHLLDKLLMTTGIAAAALIGSAQTAKADECLEVGWKDKAGSWVYYKAFVDAIDGNHVDLHYDYHHGQLELKVWEKEKPGPNELVFRGRWFEGKDAQRTGLVHMSMEKGHHRAKGWYTYGDNAESPHYEFVLRDCKR
jgi:hypothetical protein